MKAIVFETPMGWMGLAWTDKGLRAGCFPQGSRQDAEKALAVKAGERLTLLKRPPGPISDLIVRLQKEMGGAPARARKSKLAFDFEDVSHVSFYQAVAEIPRGERVDLALLAARVSQTPAVARQLLADNPIPFLIPCHRVRVSARALPSPIHVQWLELEDVHLGKPAAFDKSFSEREALAQLIQADPKLKTLFKKTGAFRLAKPSATLSPFAYLVRSIIYQQLHGKAAATIHARLKANFGGRDPEPSQLAQLNDYKLREAGLSRQKIAALRDLTRAAEEGLVPDRREIKKLSNAEIIRRLTQIRGVGRWTVEMLLIFGLGRADVVAFDDYAIKKAIALHYGLPEPLSRETFHAVTQAWKPWRSVVSWYLWRSLD